MPTTFTLTFGTYAEPSWIGMKVIVRRSAPNVDGSGNVSEVTWSATIGSDGTASLTGLPYNDDGSTYSAEWQALSYLPTPGNRVFQVLSSSGVTVQDFDGLPAASTATFGPPVSPLVTSVNGHAGAVTLGASDVGADASGAAAAAAAGKAVIADIPTAGTATGDALRAAFDARYASQRYVTDPVLSNFLAPFAGAGVQRSTTDLYYLMRHLGAQQWWRTELKNSTLGGMTLHCLRGQTIDEPCIAVNQDAASVVLTGTWTTRTDARAFNSNYADTTTVGDKATYTSPANSTGVAVLFNRKSTGGIARVKIDGDATRATLLPTAQDLVDAGTLASTVLVANAGPLAPTDRVIDMYNAGSLYDTMSVAYQRIMLADDLAAGVHAVEVSLTGAKRAAASDDMISICGFASRTADTTASTTGVTWMCARIVLDPAVLSAYEYATAIGTFATFAGNIHGYDSEQSLTFTVDGVTAALATDGAQVLGRTVVAARDSDLYHPSVNAGATKIADVQVTYTVDDLGLLVQHTRTWANASLILVDYPAMLPVNVDMTRAGINDLAADLSLTAADDSFHGAVNSDLAWLYRPTGIFASAIYLVDPNTLTNSWAASQDTRLSIQDRSSCKKVYVTRVGSQSAGVTPSVGAVWTGQFRLFVKRFPSARAALQRF